MNFTSEEFTGEAETEALRKANHDLERKLKRTKALTADLVDAVYSAAKDASINAGKPTIQRPSKDRRSKRAEVCLLPVSDWHFGKETPSFNSEVAAERVRQLSQKVLSITEIERADHPVREVHLCLLGDFLDGVMIFPGQAFEIDSTLFTQLFNVANALEGLIETLTNCFEKVHVWGQTGNHGRIGKRGDMPRGDNTDRLLYGIVKERCSDRVVWHMPESWYSIAEIGNYKALLVHGDQIKSFGGTPAFGILKKCNSWASGVLPPFKDVLLGHFHNPLVLPLANGTGRCFISPSIESDSAYAAEVVAAAGVPAQRLLYVDPVKARTTSERLIWLD